MLNMVLHNLCKQREKGLAELWIRHDIADRNRGQQSKEHIQRFCKRCITIERKDTKIDVGSRHDVLEHNKGGGDTLVLARVNVLRRQVLHGHDSLAVGDEDFAHFAKEQNAVWRGDAKKNAFVSVVHKLIHEFESRNDNSGNVVPHLNAAEQHRHEAWIEPIEDKFVAGGHRARQHDAAEVADHTKHGRLYFWALCIAKLQLFLDGRQNVGRRPQKRIKLPNVLAWVDHEQAAQGREKRSAIASVAQIVQKVKVFGRPALEKKADRVELGQLAQVARGNDQIIEQDKCLLDHGLAARVENEQQRHPVNLSQMNAGRPGAPILEVGENFGHEDVENHITVDP
eukprot:m.81532 g.81532  ORF g.81532 m.81532 type:complete len:341 (-) comp8230_c0_seq2:1794-2816(-)